MKRTVKKNKKIKAVTAPGQIEEYLATNKREQKEQKLCFCRKSVTGH